jgi:hypothetical protein
MGKQPDVAPVPSSTIKPAARECELWNDEYFSELRKDAGVPDDFLNEGWTYDKLQKGGGKGGTLMAFLWGKYIVKEMSAGDHKAMLAITSSYVEHLRGERSLICTIFLHYRDVESGRIFFVMRNEVGNGPFKALYDLKGCADDKTLERDGKSVEAVHKRIWQPHMWCGRCLWNEARRKYKKGKQDASKLHLQMSGDDRAQFVKSLAYDTEWLASQRLMDYSLLVAMKAEAPDTTTFLRVPDENGQEAILCVSIIDFLQTWGCGKRCARGIKVFEGNKATVPPRIYGARFQRHFEECFVAGESPDIFGKQAVPQQAGVAPPAGGATAAPNDADGVTPAGEAEDRL